LQIGEPLANASKIYRIYGTVLFPPTGKVGDAVLPYFGKSDIYRRKVKVSQQPFAIFTGHPDKNLLPTYLSFYGDRN
jgi:hypothetical protein